MKEMTDNELVISYREGNKDAFEFLVNRHLKSVYFYCVRLVGKDEANDLAQEVFIKIWKKLKKYDVERSFKVWMFRIARNSCLDYLRKKRPLVFSELKREDDDGGSFEDKIVDKRSGLQERLFEDDKNAELDSALAELPLPTQEVFDLYYRENLKFQEIADTMKLSINTVKSRHRRGLLALREIIESI